MLFQLTAFGSPDYNDVLNAVHKVNSFSPMEFFKPGNEKAKQELVDAAKLIADRLHSMKYDSTEYKRMEHVLDKLNMPGKTAEDKLYALERMMQSNYKVNLDMGSVLPTLVGSIIKQASDAAQNKKATISQ